MSGLYLGEDHFHEGFRPELMLRAGDELPNCPNCGVPVVWEYVGAEGTRVIDKEELSRLREPAKAEAHG